MVHLKYPCLKNIEKARIVVYSDASYKNLTNCGSQGAHIILVCDEEDHCAPIQWQSKKVKRVVKSTMAAECLALLDGVENAYYFKTMFQELLNIDMKIDFRFSDSREYKPLFMSVSPLVFPTCERRLRFSTCMWTVRMGGSILLR